WRSKSRAAGTGPRSKILSSPAPGSVSPRPLDIWAIGRLLNAFERRWGLPHLTAIDFRHWVKHLCKLRGVSAESAARLQGHTPPNGGMQGTYGLLSDQEVLDELISAFPEGAHATLLAPKVELSQDPAEQRAIAAMLAFLRGDGKRSEFEDALAEALRGSRTAFVNR